MDGQNPVYSHNPILDGIEHVGHGISVAEHVVVGDVFHIVRDGLVVAKEFKQQYPTLAAETGAVASDALKCKTLMVAIAAAAASEFNLAADAGVLAALVTDAPALIQLAADVATLTGTLTADIKQDVASL